jgi:hypothetical protein
MIGFLWRSSCIMMRILHWFGWRLLPPTTHGKFITLLNLIWYNNYAFQIKIQETFVIIDCNPSRTIFFAKADETKSTKVKFYSYRVILSFLQLQNIYVGLYLVMGSAWRKVSPFTYFVFHLSKTFAAHNMKNQFSPNVKIRYTHNVKIQFSQNVKI